MHSVGGGKLWYRVSHEEKMVINQEYKTKKQNRQYKMKRGWGVKCLNKFTNLNKNKT